MTSYAILIDCNKCIDCRICVIQCKDEFAMNDYPPYSAAMPFRGQKWISVEQNERGTFPMVKYTPVPILCQHCDNAPCMAAATGDAVYKRPDGIVIIDPTLAYAQSQLVAACPYGVVFYNSDTATPQKCTLCAHRLDTGRQPRCVQACPAGAIQVADISVLQPTITASGAVPLHPEYGTQPRVYYIGLPMTFVAGSLVNQSTGDDVKGATVVATDSAGNKYTTTSDILGRFFVDGLYSGNSYTITILRIGFETKTISGVKPSNNSLGDIQLTPT